MGAMGMYIHWRASENDEVLDFHQFFYFETEEVGLESYLGLWSNDALEVTMLEQENIGGLGGKKVPLTLLEARHILQEFCSFNQRHQIPLPDKKEEYLSLLAGLEPLSPAAEEDLFAKQCTPLHSEYALAHYFLMRCFGKDLKAAAYLSSLEPLEDPFPTLGMASMVRNSIHQDRGYFLCDSLLELEDSYQVVISEIRIVDMKVERCVCTSRMKISSQEAALILARTEFISVYQLPENPYGEVSLTLDFDTTSEVYDSGKLFFTFYEDNSHVEAPLFYLSGDVYGVHFLSNAGQLLVMSYSEETILQMERSLATSALGRYLVLTGRYQFPKPILYDFIESGCEDFNEFVDWLEDFPD